MDITRNALFKRICDFIFSAYRWACMETTLPAPKSLGLNLDLLEYQRDALADYRDFCPRTSRGTSILDYAPIPLTRLLPDSTSATAIFRDGQVAQALRDPGLMQRSLIFAFTQFIARKMTPTRFLSLEKEDSTSSTAFIFSTLVDALGTAPSDHLGGDQDPSSRCLASLREATEVREPVHLMGTTASLEAFAARLDGTFACAPSSGILELVSGNAPLPRALREQICARMGIDDGRYYRVYAKTGISSQGFEISPMMAGCEVGDRGLFVFPNWVQIFIFNESGTSPVLPGTMGRIAIFDLCNLDSPAYILTDDMGVVESLPNSLRMRLLGHPRTALRIL